VCVLCVGRVSTDNNNYIDGRVPTCVRAALLHSLFKFEGFLIYMYPLIFMYYYIIIYL
jgi:hypothetical protein